MPTATVSKRELSGQQAAVFKELGRFLKQYGYVPAGRDLAQTLAIPVNSVYAALVGLERKGYVERIPGVARGLRILKKA